MNRTSFGYAFGVVLLIFGLVLVGHTAEITYQLDIVQDVVTKDVLVRTAENVIVLMDASKSMAFDNPKYKKQNYLLQKEALAAGNSRLPDLGYNVGIYIYSPDWKEIYPVGKFDSIKVAESMKQLPPKAAGNTYLAAGLDQLENVLKNLTGRTVVYLFSDGEWENASGKKDPGDQAAELARKYNVSFMIVSYAGNPDGVKRVKDMSKANVYSRIIPFDSYITNPYYALGPLYYTMSLKTDEITAKRKVIGIKIDDINFDYDKFELKPKEKDELNQVGQFLQANPKHFVAVQGFCDNRGSADHNMKLSRDRAEAVTDYLVKNFNLDSTIVVTMWYGDMNPIADNGTADGRAKNRRVEITITDLRYLSR
jgi:OOP family OmpA-OmpF porin